MIKAGTEFRDPNGELYATALVDIKYPMGGFDRHQWKFDKERSGYDFIPRHFVEATGWAVGK